jgi:hypothetical protein
MPCTTTDIRMMTKTVADRLDILEFRLSRRIGEIVYGPQSADAEDRYDQFFR